ncbi:MAG: hypothetical protein V1896_02735 [Candidatus Zambryskibacteria bacterium]
MLKRIRDFFLNWRLRVANLLAFLSVGLIQGLTSIVLEVWWLSYGWTNWGGVRIPYFAIKFSLGSEISPYLKKFLKRMIYRRRMKHKRIRKIIAEGLVLPIFQQSTFLLSALWMGRQAEQTLWLTLFYFVEAFGCSLVYCRVLEWCQFMIAGIKNGNGNGNKT